MVEQHSLEWLLNLIGSKCDGAVNLDGLGFNKYDRRKYEILILTPVWGEKEIEIAIKLIQKYRRQLQDIHGIPKEVIDNLVKEIKEKPEVEPRFRKRKELIENDEILSDILNYRDDIVILYSNGISFIKFNGKWDNIKHNLSLFKSYIKSTGHYAVYDGTTKIWIVDGFRLSNLDEIVNYYNDGDTSVKVIKVNENEAHILMYENDFFLLYIPYSVYEKFKNMYSSTFSNEYKSSKFQKLFKEKIQKHAPFRNTTILRIPFNDFAVSKTLAILKELKLNTYFDSTFIEKLENLVENEKKVEIPETTPTGIKLFPHQIKGIEKILKWRKVLLNDEMGLGKTIQMIMATHTLNAYPVLVICPALLKYNWKKEYEKYVGSEIRVAVVENGKKTNYDKYRKSDVLVINYDILEKHLELLKEIQFKAILIDESHYIKNPKAKRTKVALEIINHHNKKGKLELVVLATGTPITKNPEDLITQLEAIGKFKSLFINKEKFRNRYIEYTYLERWITDKKGQRRKVLVPIIEGYRNLDELSTILKNSCVIRRKKEDVLKDLPPKIYENIVVNLEDKDFQEYKEIENNFVGYLKKKVKDSKIIQKKLRGVILTKINELMKFIGEKKIKFALEWIEEFFENNPAEKLVVFANHINVQEKLYEALKDKYNAVKITGDMSPEDRQKAVEKFMNDSDVKVIVLSLKAGGVGITLTSANYVLFVELDYSPVVLRQAEDRVHRISQNKTVFIYYMIANDTIDEHIQKIVKSKIEVEKAVLDSDVPVVDVSDDTLIEIVNSLTERSG